MGKVARVSAAVVLAGSVGNMIDRIRLGSVIDFIEVPIVPLFQVFNFADAFIVLGSIVFIYAIFRAS
jgi:signal peptidase II